MTVADERERVVARLVEPTRRRLAAYFVDAAKRLVPQVAAAIAPIVEDRTKARDVALLERVDVSLRSLSWDAEARALRSVLRPAYAVAGQQAIEAVGRELGVGVSYDLNARRLSSIESTLGSRIVRINDVSRTRIAGQVVDGIEKGLSTRDIVLGVPPGRSDGKGGEKPTFGGIRGLVDSWGSTGTGRTLGPVGPAADRQRGAAPPLRSTRAYLIAQTETGNAFNRSAIAGYRSSGLVDFVEVFDGPTCGWSQHNDPDLAHGSIRSLESAEKRSLSHPRCQRSFGASLRSRREAPSPFAGRKPDEVPGAAPGLRPTDQQPFSGRRVPTAPAAISDSAKAAGERLARQARAAEGEISAALERTRREVGAEFDGFDERYKKAIRIAEKASGDARINGVGIDDAVDGINDALRYTFNAADGNYAAMVRRTLEKLRAEGIELLERDGKPIFKNFWTKEGYQGVNTVMRTKSGFRFELQFGTPAQAAAKKISHELYDAQRVLGKTDPRYLRLTQEIEDLWRPIHGARPPGVDDLDDWLDDWYRAGASSTDDVAREAAREAALREASERIRYGTTETAIVVDDFGRILLDKSDGHISQVQFDAADLLAARGGTLTHNHPGALASGWSHSTSFSINDALLAKAGAFREIRAVGKGADHVLAIADDVPDFAIETAYRRFDQEVQRDFTAKIAAGRMTIAEAMANHHHELWTRLAAAMPGVTYRRTLL